MPHTEMYEADVPIHDTTHPVRRAPGAPWAWKPTQHLVDQVLQQLPGLQP
ncbi:hypothetical protein [Streptomyces spectabilis]|uniref:Uncharacterized protein n=1 Tax=Streptomyces spectabilis TaxID=68270 RepID=A0A7W8B2J3_STRST|nr:hypothetical protein [Streptomyces spectabilis]MBB5109170.1 hypothetical protein [Streptomyces spectabilis]MCI3907729.1 hypothetical protein [Streptomyces spectabilis]GGV51195.1 hypothetical protein GCM10010245_80610 [Streptomyces spectabilis]